MIFEKWLPIIFNVIVFLFTIILMAELIVFMSYMLWGIINA